MKLPRLTTRSRGERETPALASTRPMAAPPRVRVVVAREGRQVAGGGIRVRSR